MDDDVTSTLTVHLADGRSHLYAPGIAGIPDPPESLEEWDSFEVAYFIDRVGSLVIGHCVLPLAFLPKSEYIGLKGFRRFAAVDTFAAGQWVRVVGGKLIDREAVDGRGV